MITHRYPKHISVSLKQFKVESHLGLVGKLTRAIRFVPDNCWYNQKDYDHHTEHFLTDLALFNHIIKRCTDSVSGNHQSICSILSFFSLRYWFYTTVPRARNKYWVSGILRNMVKCCLFFSSTSRNNFWRNKPDLFYTSRWFIDSHLKMRPIKLGRHHYYATAPQCSNPLFYMANTDKWSDA